MVAVVTIALGIGVVTTSFVVVPSRAFIALVLMMACTNVTCLMLARTTMRERELAVRIALGAARMQLLRQLMTESMTFAIAAAVPGVILAMWGIDLLQSPVVPLTPVERTGIDGRTLVFSAATTLIIGAVGAALAWGLYVAASRESIVSRSESFRDRSAAAGS